jgi:DNA segregation ATPase FtsK/SpoIIIE-like protein
VLKELNLTTNFSDERIFPFSDMDFMSNFISSILHCEKLSYEAKGLFCLLSLHDFSLTPQELETYTKSGTSNKIFKECLETGLFIMMNEGELSININFFKTKNEISGKNNTEIRIENTELSIESALLTSKEDSLYQTAEEIVINSQRASVSFLQRKLRIGYNRSCRLIDSLADKGVIGPFEGSKPRTVLIEKSQYNNNSKIVETS